MKTTIYTLLLSTLAVVALVAPEVQAAPAAQGTDRVCTLTQTRVDPHGKNQPGQVPATDDRDSAGLSQRRVNQNSTTYAYKLSDKGSGQETHDVALAAMFETPPATIQAGKTYPLQVSLAAEVKKGTGVTLETVSGAYKFEGALLGRLIKKDPPGDLAKAPGAGGWFQDPTFVKAASGTYSFEMFAASSNTEAKITVESSVDTPVVVAEYVYSCPFTPEPAKRAPIIFLPGIGGTQLYAGSNRVWLWEEYLGAKLDLARVAIFYMLLGNASDFDEPRFKMALNLAGQDTEPKGGITPGDIMRTGPGGINFYGDLIKTLTDRGYQEGTDLALLPYDWRLDNKVHFERLAQLIDDTLAKTRQKKVVLMAHSMGGVIARAFLISNPQYAAKVDALVTMATPYWGSPKVLYALVSGYTFGNPTVTQNSMKFLAQNFPAVYQLLPRKPFLIDPETGSKLPLGDTWGIRYKDLKWGIGGWYETKTNDRTMNKGLMDLADQFYMPMGTPDKPTALPGGVKHYVLIGNGYRTLSQYAMRSPSSFAIWEARSVSVGGRNVVLDPVLEDGDGTVPIWGLEIANATETYYIPAGLGGSSAHGSVPANTEAVSIVQQIIDGKPPKSNQYPNRYADQTKVLEGGDGLDYVLHSNAHLLIQDANAGRGLGHNEIGGIVETLDKGTFLDMEGAEYAFLGDLSKTYAVSVAGNETGSFSLEAKLVKGGQTTAYIYPKVPVKQGTLAQFKITPSQTTNAMPAMQVTTGGKTTTVNAELVSQTSTGTAIPTLPGASVIQPQSPGPKANPFGGADQLPAPGKTMAEPPKNVPASTFPVCGLVACVAGLVMAGGLGVTGMVVFKRRVKRPTVLP